MLCVFFFLGVCLFYYTAQFSFRMENDRRINMFHKERVFSLSLFAKKKSLTSSVDSHGYPPKERGGSHYFYLVGVLTMSPSCVCVCVCVRWLFICN